MVLEGIAYWASITVPNTRYEPKYTIDVVVDDTTAQDLSDKGLNVKFDKEEGPTITVSRKVNGPNGMIRKAPELYDRRKNNLDCLVGNGSKVKVQAKLWEKTHNGQDFKGLDLQAVQVLNLIEYRAGDGDELDVIESDEQEIEEL